MNKEAKKSKLRELCENDVSYYVETKLQEDISNLSENLAKTGKILDACFSLLPQDAKDAFREEIGGESFSNLIPKTCAKNLKKLLLNKRRLDAFWKLRDKHLTAGDNYGVDAHDEYYKSNQIMPHKTLVPDTLIKSYKADDFQIIAQQKLSKLNEKRRRDQSIEHIEANELKRTVNEARKNKCYTYALLSIMHYITSRSFIYYDKIKDFDFSELQFITNRLVPDLTYCF
jgi:hypothetical protein